MAKKSKYYKITNTFVKKQIKALKIINRKMSFVKNKSIYKQYQHALLNVIYKNITSSMILLKKKYYLECFSTCRLLFEHVFALNEIFLHKDHFGQFFKRLNFKYYIDRLDIAEKAYSTNVVEDEDEFVKTFHEHIGKHIESYRKNKQKQIGDLASRSEANGFWVLYYKYYQYFCTKTHANNMTASYGTDIDRNMKDDEFIIEAIANALNITLSIVNEVTSVNLNVVKYEEAVETLKAEQDEIKIRRKKWKDLNKRYY